MEFSFDEVRPVPAAQGPGPLQFDFDEVRPVGGEGTLQQPPAPIPLLADTPLEVGQEYLYQVGGRPVVGNYQSIGFTQQRDAFDSPENRDQTGYMQPLAGIERLPGDFDLSQFSNQDRDRVAQKVAPLQQFAATLLPEHADHKPVIAALGTISQAIENTEGLADRAKLPPESQQQVRDAFAILSQSGLDWRDDRLAQEPTLAPVMQVLRQFGAVYGPTSTNSQGELQAATVEQGQLAEKAEFAKNLVEQAPVGGQVLLGLTQGPRSIVSTALRPLAPEESDRMNRRGNALAQGAEQGDPSETWGGYGRNMLRGAVGSLSQMAALAPGGLPTLIGGFGLTSANDALTAGKDAGLKGKELAGYAAREGLVEAGITALFSMVGMGGVESSLTGQAVSKVGLKEAFKTLGKNVGDELLEELVVEAGHAINESWSGVDPNALVDQNGSLSPLAKRLADTAVQTVMVTGMAGSPNVAREGANSLLRPDYVKNLNKATDLKNERDAAFDAVDSGRVIVEDAQDLWSRDPLAAQAYAEKETPTRRDIRELGITVPTDKAERTALRDALRGIAQREYEAGQATVNAAPMDPSVAMDSPAPMDPAVQNPPAENITEPPADIATTPENIAPTPKIITEPPAPTKKRLSMKEAIEESFRRFEEVYGSQAPESATPTEPAAPTGQPAQQKPADAGPLSVQPSEPAAPPLPPGGFRTAQGSVYEWDGKSSRRFKTPHQFHDPNDKGWKEQSDVTLFVSPDASGEIGMWQSLSNEGKRIVVRDNEVILVSRNPKTGEYGSDGRFPFTTAPEVGKSPLELREPNDKGWYRWNHPGNAITEIGSAPDAEPAAPVPSPEAEPVAVETPARPPLETVATAPVETPSPPVAQEQAKPQAPPYYRSNDGTGRSYGTEYGPAVRSVLTTDFMNYSPAWKRLDRGIPVTDKGRDELKAQLWQDYQRMSEFTLGSPRSLTEDLTAANIHLTPQMKAKLERLGFQPKSGNWKIEDAQPATPLTDTAKPAAKPVAEPVQTIAGKMTLEDFEAKGYSPDQVTRGDWVNLQRAHRRGLGQQEESGTQFTPFSDYQEYHRDAVKRAVEAGEDVDPDVLSDYPELKAKTDSGAETPAAPVETPTPKPAPKPATAPAIEPGTSVQAANGRIGVAGTTRGGSVSVRFDDGTIVGYPPNQLKPVTPEQAAPPVAEQKPTDDDRESHLQAEAERIQRELAERRAKQADKKQFKLTDREKKMVAERTAPQEPAKEPAAPRTTDPPEAASAKTTPRKPSKPKKKDPLADLERYFTPDRLVSAYGGSKDRVVAFRRSDRAPGWEVDVQQVEDENGKPTPDAPVRTHATTPTPRELRAALKELDAQAAATPVEEPVTPEPAKKPKPVKKRRTRSAVQAATLPSVETEATASQDVADSPATDDNPETDEATEGPGIHQAIIAPPNPSGGKTVNAAPFAQQPSGSRDGAKLLNRIRRDIASGKDAKVGLRSIGEFVIESVHAVMMVGKTQTTARHPAHFDPKRALIRSRSGIWQINLHEAGHALSAYLSDKNRRWMTRLRPSLEALTGEPGSYASNGSAEEGMAELVRRYITDFGSLPETLVRDFEQALKAESPAILDRLRDAHRAYQLHKSRDILQQMQANRNDTPHDRSFIESTKSVAYTFLRNVFGNSAVTLRLNRMAYFGITGDRGLMKSGIGLPALMKMVLDKSYAARQKLALEFMAQVKDTPADHEAAYQNTLRVHTEVDRAIGGVRRAREGVRILSRGKGFDNLRDGDIEILNAAGFETGVTLIESTMPDGETRTIRKNDNPVKHGKYLYLSDKSISSIKHAVGLKDWSAFEEYAQYRVALERFTNGKHEYPGLRDGLTPDVLKKWLKEQDTAHPDWHGHLKEIQRYMDQMLLVSVLGGEITAKEAATIKEKWEDYVPLARKMEKDGPGAGRGGGTDPDSGLRRAHGSGLPFGSLEAAIETRTRKSLEAYYTNALMLSVRDFAQSFDKLKKVDYDVRKAMMRLMLPLKMETQAVATLSDAEQKVILADAINRVALQELGEDPDGKTQAKVEQELERLGGNVTAPDDIDLVLPKRGVLRAKRPNAVRVIAPFENGKRTYIQVTDPHVFEMMAGGTGANKYVQWLSTFLGKPLQPWRRAITQNLYFAVANFLARDPITAVSLGGDAGSLMPGVNAAYAVVNRLLGDPAGVGAEKAELLSKALDQTSRDAHRTMLDSFKEMLAEGVLVPGFGEMTISDKIAEAPGIAMSTLMKPVDVFNWVTFGKWLSQTGESLNREGAYLRTKRRGESDAQAQLAYDKATGNFGQRQADGNAAAIVRMAGFLNPGLQILWGQGELMSHPDPKVRAMQTLVKLPIIATFAAIGSALNIAMITAMFDDEEQEEIFENMRQRKEEDRNAYMAIAGKVRLPGDYGLFGAVQMLAWNMVERAFLDEKMDRKKMLAGFFERATDLPVPTDVLHPHIKTWHELYENHSYFLHDEIVPQYLEAKYPYNPELQAFPDTPGFYRSLGKGLGVSPLKVRYGMRNIFGSLMDSTVAYFDKDAANRESKDNPLYGRLITPESRGFRSQSVRSLMDMEQRYDSLRHSLDSGDVPPEAKEQLGELAGAHQAMLAVEKLWEQAKEERDKPDADHAKVKQLEREMTATAKEFLTTHTIPPSRMGQLIYEASHSQESLNGSAKLSEEADRARRVLSAFGITREEAQAALRSEWLERAQSREEADAKRDRRRPRRVLPSKVLGSDAYRERQKMIRKLLPG